MEDKIKILKLLSKKHNVLLLGAPGTGKSRIMNEVAAAFEEGGQKLKEPTHIQGAPVPIPAVSMPDGYDLPIFEKANRKVFRTTFHQNSKYRDFLTGIVPCFGEEGGYEINKGILYRANEYAKQQDSAALLIIDELNRGPAIEVFGGSIVAIESDKRLGRDNEVLTTTQFFELLDPVSHQMEEYAFSPNLYILAAMNQADASVAPLDVAFLRRWQSYMLEPNYDVLYRYYNVNPTKEIALTCETAEDAYRVAFCALEKINKHISIGRGKEYQIGQGVFLSTTPENESREAALEFITEVWSIIYAHIQELFFGDSVSLAYIINAASEESPYELEELVFAEEAKTVIKHQTISKENIYDVYLAIARQE